MRVMDMESIVEILADYAAKKADHLCIVDGAGENTYGQVWTATREIAKKLTALGVRKGDCVMVECTQDVRFLICDFASQLLGVIFVPVDKKASLERVNMVAEETEAKLFIHETEYVVEMNGIVMSEFYDDRENADDMEYVFPKGGDTAQILYTTGTTGKSKGIEVTHGNNIALAENIKYGTEMKEGNIELVPLPLSHSHALRCCYANLLNGSAIVLTDGVTRIKSVLEMMTNYHVTALDFSPSAVQVLIKLAKDKFYAFAEQIDYIQIGTAPLSEETKELLTEKFANSRLYNFYGSTESGRTCVLDFNKDRNKKHCIGKPTCNAGFIVTDDERKEIRSSESNPGLLASAGPMNMKGYWKQPELTAQTMHDGFVYTNDLGYIDEDGYVYVLGRKDDVINYKGIKIAPEEIEESVKKYAEIIDCACVPKADKMMGQVPKLFVVVRDKNAFRKIELFKFLEAYVDANKMPKEIEVIDEIPRTANGKIQRAKLVEK